MQESLKGMPVVDLEPGWWLNHGYRGGVAKRVGWWVTEGRYRTHWYIVVFRDGHRSEPMPGTNPIEEI